MIVQPVQNMCGTGLISGFFPAFIYTMLGDGESGENQVLRDTKKYSGVGRSLFEPISGFEDGEYSRNSLQDMKLLGLQLLYAVKCARFPTYTIYLSNEYETPKDLLDLLDIKPLRDFVNYNSGVRCYVYNVDQSELHDKLLKYCQEKYNQGAYLGLKGEFCEEILSYLIEGYYSTPNPEEEAQDDDYDDYDYDDEYDD